MPARADPELLPTLFQNTRRYLLHEDFVREVFPERFPDLSAAEFETLVARKATRSYFIGSLQILVEAGSPRYCAVCCNKVLI